MESDVKNKSSKNLLNSMNFLQRTNLPNKIQTESSFFSNIGEYLQIKRIKFPAATHKPTFPNYVDVLTPRRQNFEFHHSMHTPPKPHKFHPHRQHLGKARILYPA